MELQRLNELTQPHTPQLRQKMRDAQAYLHVLRAVSLVQDNGREVSEPTAYLVNENVILEWVLSHATLKVEFTGEGEYIYSKQDPNQILTKKKNLRHTLEFLI